MKALLFFGVGLLLLGCARSELDHSETSRAVAGVFPAAAPDAADFDFDFEGKVLATESLGHPGPRLHLLVFARPTKELGIERVRMLLCVQKCGGETNFSAVAAKALPGTIARAKGRLEGNRLVDVSEVSFSAPPPPKRPFGGSDHRFFVSSIESDGNLRGLAGADKICSDLAARVPKLAAMPSWKAILVNAGQPLEERITFKGRIFNVLDELVAKTGEQLLSGTLIPTASLLSHKQPIRMAGPFETGGYRNLEAYQLIGGRYWNGLSAKSEDQTCLNWTTSHFLYDGDRVPCRLRNYLMCISR